MESFATSKAPALGRAMHQLTCYVPKCRHAVRIMKLTAIILLAACLQLSARGLTQTVTISVKDAPLLTVLKAIEKQTDYLFFVDNQWLQKSRKVTLTANNLPLQQVLELCFKDQPLTYTVTGKVINVIPKEEKAGIVNNKQTGLDAEVPQSVRGKIVNENGEPVIATVTVKGKKIATTTNDDGEFYLQEVDGDATLVITGVGLETREIKINSKTDLFITVKIALAPLEEAVIKGYYTTTKKLNTGSVSIVKGTDIQKQPVSDPILALEGLVPGLYIRAGSGLPGAQISNIILRGKNSLRSNSTNPLFIIDGVPYPSTSISTLTGVNGATGLSTFNNLNSSDIETIQILKDADATAIYGSRGANGVILITTKKGKAGKTKVNLNVFHGFGFITKKLNLLNTQQYIQLRREAFLNDGIAPTTTNARDILLWDTTRYTDWQKILIGGGAKQTNLQGTISGGNTATQFLISGGYRKQSTVLPGDFYDRTFSFHSNLSHSIGNRYKIDISILHSNNFNKMPTQDPTNYILLAPNAPMIYKDNGELNWENNSWINPFSVLKTVSESNSNNIIGNINIQYKLSKNWLIRSLFGYNYLNNIIYNLSPIAAANPAYANSSSRSSTNSVFFNKTLIAEPQINYNYKIKKHILETILGVTFQETLQDFTVIKANGFTSDALLKNISAASTKDVLITRTNQYKLNKLFGRIGYSIAEKYLINLTGSREGSSRFGANNKFGNFGAIGFGYIFSKETFVEKSIPFLSFGKIKLSYGTTGNDQIPDYQYLSTYSSSSLSYQNLTGLTPTSIANPNLQWEAVKKMEIGLELGFFDDKIQLFGSYFRNRTGNQLVNYTLPTTTGFSGFTANLPAIIQNTGLELTFVSTIIKNKNFSWVVNVNVTFPNNKLVSFPKLKNSTYSTIYEIGRSLDIKYSYHFTGLDSNTGLYTVQDVNNDGSITSVDKLFTGETKQNYFGGVQNRISYKNFNFDFLFQFVDKYATNIYSSLTMPGAFNGDATANQEIGVLDRWKKAGDVSSFPRASQNFSSQNYVSFANARSSDKYIQRLYYWRLRNIFISYEIPKGKLKGINSSRIYLSGQNLLTLSNYKGADPETTNYSTVPPLRMFTFGFQLMF